MVCLWRQQKGYDVQLLLEIKTEPSPTCLGPELRPSPPSTEPKSRKTGKFHFIVPNNTFSRHRVWLDEEVTGRNEVTTTIFYVWPLWCACSFSGCKWAYCHGTLLCEFSIPKCGGVLGGNDQIEARSPGRPVILVADFHPPFLGPIWIAIFGRFGETQECGPCTRQSGSQHYGSRLQSTRLRASGNPNGIWECGCLREDFSLRLLLKKTFCGNCLRTCMGILHLVSVSQETKHEKSFKSSGKIRRIFLSKIRAGNSKISRTFVLQLLWLLRGFGVQFCFPSSSRFDSSTDWPCWARCGPQRSSASCAPPHCDEQ